MATLAAPASTSASQQHRPPPNIVVIQSDDQNARELNRKTMPATERLLVQHGTTFSHYVVATPLCCPSRASLLTGEYPHNDGVTSNDPGYASLIHKGNILPAWLQAAGYRTAQAGKYMNEYELVSGSIGTPAPGWDRWYGVAEKTRYYNYPLGVNGTVTHRGHAPRDYVTRVLNHAAVHVIRSWGRRRQPFYLQLDERAPHESAAAPDSRRCPAGPLPDPRDTRRFAHRPLRRPPSFNEADTSDKPQITQAIPRLNHQTIVAMTKTQRCRLASLRGIDRGVAAVHRALLATRSLRRTVIVYISDNGSFAGEHRLPDGKVLPYYEAIHQPFVIRVPPGYAGKRQPRVIPSMAANIDLAPTLLELANASPCRESGRCRTMDGRSLVPLLRGRKPGWSRHRPILTELSRPPADTQAFGVCAYRGVNTPAGSYVDYTSVAEPGQSSCQPTDQVELYDLRSDPFQLNNLYPAAPGTDAGMLQAKLQAALARLQDCSGISGRDPVPPSGHYCD